MIQMHEDMKKQYDAARNIVNGEERQAYLESIRQEREKNRESEQNMREALYKKKKELIEKIDEKTKGIEL